MTDSSKARRRLAYAAIVVVLLALAAAWISNRRQVHRHTVTQRWAGIYRERYTPKAHAEQPGTIGILIAFAPETPPPVGGWKPDTQLRIESTAAWLDNPELPFQLDRNFGAIGVTLPAARNAIARPVGAAPPPGPPQTPQPPLDPHRVGFFAARGTVKVSDVEALKRTLLTQPSFRGIFSDPPIVSDADGSICLFPPIGSSDAVVESARPDASSNPKKVLLGIVDLGFSEDVVSYSAADVLYKEDLGYSPGSGLGNPGDYPGDEHGNMCAYDATLVAPHATLVDIRVGDGETQRLSDAEKAYNALYTKLTELGSTLKDDYQGLVLSNSWGLYTPDNQLDQHERYFDNPEHPFTLAVKKLIAEGVDVVFSAGDSGCGATGGAIWGANSLADVISVAAVDANKARITYSSQGPGTLATQKPDVSGYSEFIGKDDEDVDTGTSASAAVVAGIVAAIRAKPGMGWKQMTPAQIKEYMKSVADRDVTDANGSPMTLTAWSPDFGWGIARVK